jgi:hypothetical protein
VAADVARSIVSCRDRHGIVAALSAALADVGTNIIGPAQHSRRARAHRSLASRRPRDRARQPHGRLPLVMRALVVLVCALAAVPVATASPRVLFVGNSLTAANDLPGMVARVGGFDVVARTPGGYSLEDHWQLTDVEDVIAQGSFEFVVLQQGPSSLPDSGANLVEWTKTFADAIRGAGAKPVVYMVWPESYRRSVLNAVISNYRRAARESASLLAPVGEVWKRAPGLALYGRDGFHPSRLGTYAAAVTITAVLAGRSPVGLPVVAGISATRARAVQRAAAAALGR